MLVTDFDFNLITILPIQIFVENCILIPNSDVFILDDGAYYTYLWNYNSNFLVKKIKRTLTKNFVNFVKYPPRFLAFDGWIGPCFTLDLFSNKRT